MELVFITILGMVIGSFLNVCIFRIPKEESISYPPSHCSDCGHALQVIDLIPIISYLFLGGKCRYCRKHISIQYPIIELLNGLLFFLIGFKYEMTLTTVKYCILASTLIVIGMIDFKTQFVYRCMTVFGGICGTVLVTIDYLMNNTSVINYILGGVIGAAAIAVIVYTTHGMGEGDIEIAALCGLFIGIKGILITLFLSVIIGGIVGVIVLALKLKDYKDKIAFGPCLAAGAIIYVLIGNEMVNAYMKLFI